MGSHSSTSVTSAANDLSSPTMQPKERTRVVVLRGVDGAGGGADEIILRTATAIDHDQIQMTVCFFKHRNDNQFTFARRSEELGIDYRIVEHSGPFDRQVLPQLRQHLVSLRPHVLHSHDYKASFFVRRLSREFRIPCVATAHGWTGHAFRERWLYYPADRRQLRQFHTVIAVSEEIRQTLIRSGVAPEHVQTLLNGVDPQEFQVDDHARSRARAQLRITDDEWVIGAVGRVEQQKRFDLLVEMFAKLRTELPEARLLIAGDGSLLPALRRQVERLQLGDACRLLGHCDSIRDVYPAFDLLVQSSDYEGTPTVVVEAMALKIPIVATDVGGTSQLVTHNQHALLVPRRDPAALAAAIRQIRNDPRATQSRVAAARQRVETELNFAARTQKLQVIYRSAQDSGARMSAARMSAVGR